LGNTTEQQGTLLFLGSHAERNEGMACMLDHYGTTWKTPSLGLSCLPIAREQEASIRHLVPEVECYDVCEKGWDGHETESLVKFINEGKTI